MSFKKMIALFKSSKQIGSKFSHNELSSLSVIASVAFHVGVFILLMFHKGFKLPELPPKIEITVIDNTKPKPFIKPPPKIEPPKKETQVVEQDKKQIQPQPPNPNAKFLGAKNNTIAKETRAKKSGKFANSEAAKKEVVTNEKSDIVQEQANSQTDDYLKDVADGMQTMLNTQEFEYYGYYQNLKQKVKKHWDIMLGEKVALEMQQSRGIASSEQMTRLHITLDKEGALTNIEVTRSSGQQNADKAAVEAFRKASPFGAPPKGLVNTNGEVQMNWDLVVGQFD